MAKVLTFYSQHARVTVIVNGVPVSINAQVQVDVTELSVADQATVDGWGYINQGTNDLAVTVENLQKA